MGIDHLFHERGGLVAARPDPVQQFIDAQDSQLKVLSEHQAVLFKERNLDAAAAEINDGSASSDDPAEPLPFRGDRFIVQEALLGIAQHVDMYSRLLFDLPENYRGIFHISESTCGVGFIVPHTVAVHGSAEIQKDPFDFRDMGKADPALFIGVGSQVDQMYDVIELTDSVLFGKFKNLEFYFVAADIDRAKKISHLFPLF